ncbi:SdiA-regulated domain-containing protein [candidate division KSB1 bacterium]|nr:SdiA-regulated domain-containing protein [candidate division KSB1 bacterium]MBL7094935.1 SdiA-regulated domain-containing protein [candidate division KSB1 bacterium]
MKKLFFIIWLLGLLIFAFCTKESSTKPKTNEPYLKKEADYKLDVEEPSGLAFSVDGNFLWTISDKTNKVYQITLTGTIVKELSYTGNDLEGIVQHPGDSTLWVVEEYQADIVQLDTSGNELKRVSIPVNGGGSSLEGITINPANNHLYLVKEKNPGVLIHLNEKHEMVSYLRISFAGDYSGIYFDAQNSFLWIISDQDKTVFKCDLSGKVLEQYPVDVNKIEGIAVDVNNSLIYLVSDSYERLYVYSIQEVE